MSARENEGAEAFAGIVAACAFVAMVLVVWGGAGSCVLQATPNGVQIVPTAPVMPPLPIGEWDAKCGGRTPADRVRCVHEIGW